MCYIHFENILYYFYKLGIEIELTCKIDWGRKSVNPCKKWQYFLNYVTDKSKMDGNIIAKQITSNITLRKVAKSNGAAYQVFLEILPYKLLEKSQCS